MSKDNSDRLRITEIFFSLQGESRSIGFPTVFIRLTGCPLRCAYCDSAYAFQGGEWQQIQAIVEQVASYKPRFVTVTGGEPLAQKNVHRLLTSLCDQGFNVSLETSGAIDISAVDIRVSRVVDVKTPGSGEASRNRWENLLCLNKNDQIKFVLVDRADYEWAIEKVREHDLSNKCEVLFSPVWGSLAPRELADWIVEDRLNIRFQLQLHKILWGDEPGR
ncbi:MAG: 7-carboxy-7-deazaguanine synthase QueE [Gammaproteobacteria bacterium]|nr:7-carboxy-7-deazaguanine synthase QueE [Gammaproteobacteria bacterium]